jgi:hypothetical protein
LITARPVSSLGRNPFGTARQSGTIATRTSAENAITVRGWESDQRRPRSYTRTDHANPRSVTW